MVAISRSVLHGDGVPRFEVITWTGAGTAPVIVAPGPGKQIVLMSYAVAATGDTALRWQDDTGDLSGDMPVAARALNDASSERGLLACRENEGLNLVVADAVNGGGHVSYMIVGVR